jgi:hypothetical protein
MKTEAQAKACTLLEFIDLHFEGNQSAFGRAQDVSRQQVREWVDKDFIVVNGRLYSPRRELKT